jgi:hypothetical protein
VGKENNMVMEEKKKPFKDTKVGQFLSTKAPKILDAVGDLLPDQGVIGIVKRIISSEESPLTPEDQIEGMKLIQDFELEVFGMEIQDKASAREREVGFLDKLSHIDWMQIFTGISVIAAFWFMLYTVVFITLPEPNRELFIHLLGIIEGAYVGGVVGYYYGTSKGSADKTKLLAE